MKTYHQNENVDGNEVRTEQAKTRAAQAKTSTEQAETRKEQAETKTAQAKTWTMEQSLRASELSYRRLFEAAKDGILILDFDTGRINDVNPFLFNLLGFSRAEMMGKTVGELSPFKDIEENKVMLLRLQKDGYVRYEDLPMETRDGKHIAVEFVSNVYQAGDVNVIQCNVRDITERKQIEEARRMSDARYRALFDHAPDGIVIANPNSYYLDANSSICRMLGYAREELIGLHASNIVIQSEIKYIGPALSEIKARTDYHREWQFRRKDGSVFPAEVIATMMPDGNLMGMIRDITARKQTEAALIRLASIVEFSDDAIIGKDLDSTVTSWNRGAEKIFGYTAGEMVGASIMRLIPADRQDEEIQILEKVKRGESVEHFDTLRQAKDGRLINISVTASPIKDTAGKVVGVSKVARDISQRKAVQEKIQQLNVELEQRVIERTAQLQSANEELEAFSYSVSHDLRAPLRHVMGFVNLLQNDAGPSLSEKNTGYLTTISQSAKRMGNLIDDLLTFSRVGRAEIQKANINLDELVRETLGDFQAETNARTIVWEIHPLPFVRADRALLRLVLVNLVSNAVKFTCHRTEAKIEIGCVETVEGRESKVEGQTVSPSTLDPRPSTVIYVRDNGAGFDPLYAHKLFGVFQRLHSNEEFEGTGIGLANVQRIIQRFGGRVWAEGAVDAGATFYFSIPKQPNGATHGHTN
jgi:PAS domain S-box-containing protein